MLTNRNSFRLLLFSSLILMILSSHVCLAAGFTAPENIGGRFSPYALPNFSEVPFWIPPLTGLVAGLLTSAIGVGGGFMVVPTLMTYGVAGIYAVGAEMFRIFIFTLVQAIRLGLRKKIRYLFSGILSIGTTIGGFAGLFVSTAIYMNAPTGSNLFISLMIIMWLITYSFIIVPDFKESAVRYARQKAREKEKDEELRERGLENSNHEKDPVKDEETGLEKSDFPENETITQDEKKEIQSFESHQLKEAPWDIAFKIRSLKIPPYVYFPSSLPLKAEEAHLKDKKNSVSVEDKNDKKNKHDRISAIPIFLFSIAGGFFMALTGSGGLIFGFTIFTRGFACVAEAMAGSDFARIAFSSGALTMGGFGLKGFISFYSVTGLILGSILGVHLGGLALEYIKPYKVKGLLALTLITVITNRLLTLPEYLKVAGADLPQNLCTTLAQSAEYILLIGIMTTTLWILFELFIGVRSKIRQKTDEEETT